MPVRLPIVFLGPSMPLARARELLVASYRPPVRRGDLDDVPPGSLVAIIDGVFEQSLAVSPREVHDALARGVTIVGGASMGALRAAEVPGVIGVGRIYEWYRDGVVSRDDEVALSFDPASFSPLSVPMVNVRYAVDRLCRPGTLPRAVGDALIAAALALPYERRQYPAIVRAAGVAGTEDAAELVAMLEVHDLKHDDAQLVVERLEQVLLHPAARPGPTRPDAPAGEQEILRQATDDHGVSIWESGDRVDFPDLLQFLTFTGKLERHVRAAVARYALEGNTIDVEGSATPEPAGESVSAQEILDAAAQRWGWLSAEEAQVTLADLGLPFDAVAEHCAEEAAARRAVRTLVREGAAPFRSALRAELLLDGLALKRETLRLASLRYFADLDDAAPGAEELSAARRLLCKINGVLDFSALRAHWSRLGVALAAQEHFVHALARARRAGAQLRQVMSRGAAQAAATGRGAGRLSLRACKKPPNEARFAVPVSEALAHAERLREVVGITRVGMIGELSELGGVQIAQAARPDNAWSSTYGSGKATTREGAIVGSIMEETEKWAQERFAPDLDDLLVGSYAQLRERHPVIDPALLDLPHDTVYHPQLELPWYECSDLLAMSTVYLPVDVLQMRRRKHDICFSPRGARKLLHTNGLGSGFAREEAILHALCEYVERHAMRIAELYLSNPGGLGIQPYRFVDLGSAPHRVRALAERLSAGTVRVLDITSEIAIPTFAATITHQGRRSDGHATHPNPAVAMEMALLEAAQTTACAAAGGREDLSIRARSLGRHERPRPVSVQEAWFWLDPEPELVAPFDDSQGLVTDDIHQELCWCLDRLREAGIDNLPVLDLTVTEIRPAHVVRVCIPGVETNNPFRTGARARLALVRDLLPRWR